MPAPYKTFTVDDLNALRAICGNDRVIAREEIGEDYCHDELSGVKSRPDALVKAMTTEEVSAINEGRPVEPSVFPYQIAFNLIPQIGNFTENGYTAEEMKMQNEGRKILHLPELLVGCTCVRVPVYRSHSISITLRTESPISVADAQKAISEAAGCRLVDNPEAKEYPMPIDTSDQDIVFVGRIRKDLTSENGLSLWCCGDQVRKGAATNTIQIAELLIK
jgi:aspartate-semialdehyde dehydrogenase